MPGSSANASRAPGPPSAPGPGPRTLGKYQLLRLLARGGMGEVHLAKLPGEFGFEKQLVIKTIRAEFAADPRFVEMFAAEAKTAVGLSHPNIAPIYELGRAEDGTLYAAMGWVDGPSLQALLDRLRALDRRLEPGAVLFIARELLDGLAHAHARDLDRPPIVHRDVTPRNVLVDRSGRIQIVDFGIAKAANAQVRGAMGSAGYMAPEQGRGELADPRADVFSVGCVIYELLTNARAFTGEGVWLSPSFTNIPAQLRPALERALALDPADRFADAAALHRALAPILAELAPAFGSRDLATIVRELFPEGWDPSPADPSVEQTPATKVTRAPQTFATRLDALAPQAPNDEAEPSPSLEGDAPDTNTSQTPPVSALWRRGTFALAFVLLALALAWLAGWFDTDPASPAPAPARPSAVQPPTAAIPERPPAREAPPTPEPTLPSPAPAQLILDPEDAQVQVDGQPLAGPPYLVPLTGERSRRVEVRRAGHRGVTLELDPLAPPTGPTQIRLEPLGQGTLSVLSPTVAWAEVWLDGAKLGTTPLTNKAVREGAHELEVRCTAAVCGRARVLLDRTIKIRAGKHAQIRAGDL